MKTVSIRHKPGAYKLYRALNNKMWYALSEYVDNALQSFENNKDALYRLHGNNYKCIIEIDIDATNQIRIFDTAGGISEKDFSRAFEPANAPENDTGLSEYGMGLKIASIWFGDKYTVKSSALGENVVRKVEFELQKVIESEMEELEVIQEEALPNKHFTEVVITRLSNNAPTGNRNQLKKIESHLSSIYRNFIRKGNVEIRFNGEPLRYIEPKVLIAPPYNDLNGTSVHWRKEIKINHHNYEVTGFIALLDTMKNSDAGLSLFRRGRVIEGSHDEKYKNKLLSGSPGSPRDKRLFGELELKGFNVSFEKGAFVGNEDFEALFKLIKDDLSSPNFPLLRQAEKYRKTEPYNSKNTAASIGKQLKRDYAEISNGNPINIILPTESVSTPTPRVEEEDKVTVIDETYTMQNGVSYSLNLELVTAKNDSSLYTIISVDRQDVNNTKIRARFNFSHQYCVKTSRKHGKDSLSLVSNLIKSLIVAEIHSVTLGTTSESNIRKSFNELLRKQ